MGSQPDQAPLIVVVGETASGKTALAIQLAKQFNGEIIAADSRTIYQGMDIGTAKPLVAEQDGVPHHLLDVVRPDQSFSAAEFQRRARQAIADITRRGRLPIMVGGTGLYIDAILFDFQFGPKPNPVARQQFQEMSVQELQVEVLRRGIALPTNERNPRHLIRALETGGVRNDPRRLRPNTLVLGLSIDGEVLRHKLEMRVRTMIDAGFVEEVRQVADRYGWSAPGLQAPGYRAFRPYIEGVQTLDEACAQFVRNDWLLAKRQRTWFKRNKSIHWISKQADAVDLVTTFLNK